MKLWGIRECVRWWKSDDRGGLLDERCCGPRGELLFWVKKKAIDERDLARCGVDFPDTIQVALYATVERAKEGR